MLSLLRNIENFIAPEFDGHNNGADLARAFRLLVRAIIIFGAAIALWSIAAGFLQAGNWTGGGRFNGKLAFWDSYPLPLLVLGGGAFLGAKLLGALALVAMAAGLAGGFLGFLFGLPSRNAATDADRGASPSATGKSSDRRVRGWVPSTNLIQITDWLTKIIVGVGLVEAKQVYGAFVLISTQASEQLLGGAYGSGVVAPSVIIGSLVLGFKICNLYTLLFLARLIADAGDEMMTKEQKLAVGELVKMAWGAPEIVPPLEPGPSAGGRAQPIRSPAPEATSEQQLAAVEIGEQPLENLTTEDAMLAWARGKALLNNYRESVDGYRKLIMRTGSHSAELLAEAARVFAMAGLEADAKSTLAQAVSRVAGEPATKRVPIMRDHVVTLLYEDPPQGYEKALQVLDDELVAADDTGELALFRACALGQKFAHPRAPLDEVEKAEIRRKVLADVGLAIQRGQDKDWIQYLADPDAPNKPAKGSREREDDLEPFAEDAEFRSLVGLGPKIDIVFAAEAPQPAAPAGEPG